MNFSTLSSTEKMAAYASLVVVVTAIVSLVNDWGGLIVVPLLAAIGMLAVLFAPSIMPNTKLPGSKGSLLVVTGGAAALFWAISALSWLDWIFRHLATFDTIQYLVGLVAALGMGWFGWQAFQAEGGNFTFGAAGASSAAAAPPAPPVPPAAPPPPSAPPPPPAGEPPTYGDAGSGEERDS
jgi:hypothetical protein